VEEVRVVERGEWGRWGEERGEGELVRVVRGCVGGCVTDLQGKVEEVRRGE
jgi:hypothetical protein